MGEGRAVSAMMCDCLCLHVLIATQRFAGPLRVSIRSMPQRKGFGLVSSNKKVCRMGMTSAHAADAVHVPGERSLGHLPHWPVALLRTKLEPVALGYWLQHAVHTPSAHD